MECYPLTVWMILPIILPATILGRPSLPLSIVVDCCQSDQPFIFYISAPPQSVIFTSGTLYPFFGAAPILWCLYLFFMCITFYLVLVIILQCLLLGVYVKYISRGQSDHTSLSNSIYICIICSITCFKLDKLK